MSEEIQVDESKLSSKELKALAKARRRWYTKKRFWALGVLGLIIVGTALGSGGDKEKDKEDKTAQPGKATQDTTATKTKQKLFPDRVDSQSEDQERNMGEGAELSGYTATVASAGYQPSVSTFEEKGYIVAEVTILNRDEKAQSYNYYDWKIQTPSGQIHDPSFTAAEGALDSGDMVSNGNVAGKVVFEVGSEKGDFYIIYKPDPFDAARGIWKVTL